MILQLNNWRCFDSLTINLPQDAFIIIDQNGSGKTSILSALYSLLTGAPFPNTKFTHSLKFQKDYFGLQVQNYSDQWFLNGKISPSGRLTIKFEHPEFVKLNFLKNNQAKVSLDDLQIFTYLPTDNTWLFENRTQKLKILDDLLSQIYGKPYTEALKKLQQACTQKLSLIKNSKQKEIPVDYTLYLTFSELIFAQSQILWNFRAKFFAFWQNHLFEFVSWIDSKFKNWQIVWQITDSLSQRQKQSTLTQNAKPDWQQFYRTEVVAEKILYGASRDDFSLKCNGLDCQSVLSRGEMRSLVLFIKNLASTLAPKPYLIWLVDDIFNELDSQREQIVFQNILQKANWFVSTSTKKLDYLSVSHYSVNSLIDSKKIPRAFRAKV